MGRLRLPAVVLSGVTAAAVTIGSVAPAAALPGTPSELELLEQSAAAASAAADQAFIDADWSDVLAQADAFDAIVAELRSRRDAAANAVAAAEQVRDEAAEIAEAAEADHRAKQIARNKAKKAADAQEEVVNAARVARNGAVKALRAAEAEVERLEGLVPAAEQAVTDAEAAAAATATALATAEADYQTPVATLIGAPAWWTDVVSEPLTVAQLFSRIADAETAVEAKRAGAEAAQAAIDSAQSAYDAATGFVKLAAALRLAEARLTHGPTLLEFAGLQARVTVLQRAADETGATALRTALNDAQAAHTAALGAVADAEQALSDLEADVDAARLAAVAAQEDKDAKQAALFAAQDLRDELKAAQQAAHDALIAAKGPRDAAVADLEAAQADLDAAEARLAEIDAVLGRLADALRSVADRRADLADFERVRSEVVWNLLDGPQSAQTGDVVTLSFTVPGSTTFDLLDASVAVVQPDADVAACDIPADGIVPAGTVVTCEVEHTVTFEDLLEGAVTVKVELTGFLPLGPGNPRATAATRTALVVEHEVSFEVLPAAAPVATEDDVVATEDEEAPAVETTSEELSDTGADTSLVTFAAVLVAVGAALVIGTRRQRA
ncbi:hypothetical protein [Demequina sp. NBRC 110056]|uniref:hypothetical protein n=1 Tax=Demequina sp. NBRC 110056 TaxID=1570345 RepID=UPI000A035721|nr:hypothetical protein [Demequina sp. NBRC 110056]